MKVSPWLLLPLSFGVEPLPCPVIAKVRRVPTSVLVSVGARYTTRSARLAPPARLPTLHEKLPLCVQLTCPAAEPPMTKVPM